MEIVEINKDDLIKLVRDQEWGDALYNEGVDNWNWYDEALEEYRSKDDVDFENIANVYIKTSIEDLYKEIIKYIDSSPIITFKEDIFMLMLIYKGTYKEFVGSTIRSILEKALKDIKDNE